MFETKVLLADENISIGKKKIPWSSIAGVRINGENFPSLIADELPTIELFLNDGRVPYLSKKKNFFFRVNNNGDSIKISIKESISIIKDRSINSNPLLNNWFEWRLIVLTILFQIIGTFISVFDREHIDADIFFKQLVETGLMYGLIGMVIGLIWERKARKKIINKQ